MNSMRSLLALVIGVSGLANSIGEPPIAALSPDSGTGTRSEPSSPVWQRGTHYDVLEPGDPAAPGSVKIRVVEFFWYGCSHCYELEAHLERWNDSRPDYIEFVRVPTQSRPVSKAHARLYYTLVALGRPDLHIKVFETMHHGRKGLFSARSETETLQLQAAFAARNGISVETFTTAYRSASVEAAMRRADALARRYKVIGVPTVVVNGRYLTSSGRAGSSTNLLAIVSDLAARERPR